MGASAALAIVGCVICAVAPNAIVFVVGRALQGAGGGASTALAEVIVSDLIPAEFRPRWLMIMNVIWALGTTIGPLVGAVLVDTNIWVRSNFYHSGDNLLTSLAEVGFLHKHRIAFDRRWSINALDDRPQTASIDGKSPCKVRLERGCSIPRRVCPIINGHYSCKPKFLKPFHRDD